MGSATTYDTTKSLKNLNSNRHCVVQGGHERIAADPIFSAYGSRPVAIKYCKNKTPTKMGALFLQNSA